MTMEASKLRKDLYHEARRREGYMLKYTSSAGLWLSVDVTTLGLWTKEASLSFVKDI